MDAPDFIPDDQPQQASPQATPPDFIPDEQANASNAPDFIPDSHVQDTSKYETSGQQALTGLEGLGRGVTAGLSDALAVGMRKGAQALGVPEEDLHYIAPKPEDIAGRQKANPIESTGAEIVGNVMLMNKLPQVGSKAINGMLQMGLISGGDEISKAMLGQGDPVPAAAAHIAEAGALGLVTGGLFGKLEKVGDSGLKTLENKKYGAKVTGFLSGIGHAATFPGSEVSTLSKSALVPSETYKLDPVAFKIGQKAYNEVTGNLAGKAAKFGADYAGYKVGGLPGIAIGHIIGQHLEKAVNTGLPKVSQKYIGPTLLKAAASGRVENISQLLDHATSVGKGAQKISRGVEALFNAGSNEALNYEASEKEREKLKSFIEDDGLGQQIQDENNQTQAAPGFAKGGQVTIQKPNEVADSYPEQNVLLSAAKGRISGYLNSLRPVKNMAKLPFDSDHKDPQKEREYDRAIDFANQPLSILKKIKKGTLVPKDMAHMTNLYPELHSHLSSKITEEIAKHKMNETKKPPYHVRQALSLFLGSNLDSSLTQPNMMAAQNVFAQHNAQKQMPQSKGSLSKIGEATMTDDQSREKRLNKN